MLDNANNILYKNTETSKNNENNYPKIYTNIYSPTEIRVFQLEKTSFSLYKPLRQIHKPGFPPDETEKYKYISQN